MARIPLRAYNHEIENLIDRGQIEEAIAHAKNILKQYPKHIETYRLLGKAYLESQRYSEAADILQRVLSVIPDDFVSQLGMSIIREDEGNLDAAIWHMERAYEVQPFNRAVQDELRRLYGRRDGVEPPRVRLTRGSLVRMYARGELFPQAIAETRAALAEDPQRLDLQMLLARIYYLTGQKVEAAEIASSLIGKLPYSLEANRILMEILPGTSRAEEARNFQRRVYDLDPYAQFISPNAPTSGQVPDQSVMVERVDWQPSMQESQSPDWARDIGVKWEATEEALPEWLNTVNGSAQAPTQQPAPEHDQDQIPDFMRSAGWNASATAENDLPPADVPTEEIDAPISQAEIPDWLQSMAPTGGQVEETGDQSRLDWLDSILPASATDAPVLPPTEHTEEAVSEPVPQEAKNLEPSAQTESDQPEMNWLLGNLPNPPAEEAPIQTDEIPDWLKDFTAQNAPTAPDNKTAEQAAPENDVQVPAWESNLPEGAAPGAQELRDESEFGQLSVDNLPDWLRETSGSRPPAQAPEWMQQEEEITPEANLPWQPQSEQPEEPAKTGELPAWLRNEPNAQTEAQSALPDWLSQTSEQAMDQKEDLSWLDEITASTVAHNDLQDASVESAASIEDDGLKAELSSSETASTAEEIPDWLKSLEPPALSGEEEAITAQAPGEGLVDLEQAAQVDERPQAVSSDTQKASPDLTDMDAAMAWLEGLAAKQGADEESLKITSPDQRTEIPPDWIAELSAAIPAEPAPEETELSPTQTSSEADEAPDWLRESLQVAPSETVESSEQETEAGDEFPDWLSQASIQEVSPTSIEQNEMEAPAAQLPTQDEPDAADQRPAWLLTDAAQEPGQSTPAAQPVETSAQDEGLPPSTGTAPDLNDMDAAMAWLEGLAAKQGADEETLKITSPDQRSETPPEWVAEMAAQESQSHQAQPVEPPALEDELPAETNPITSELSTQTAQSTERPVEPTISEAPRTESDLPTVEKPVHEPHAEPEASEPAIPDWLLNYEEEQQQKTQAWEAVDKTKEAQASATDDSLTLWLQRHHPEPGNESTTEQTTPAVGDTPLTQAQQAMARGDIHRAADLYSKLLESGQNIEEAIQDLREAVYRHPVDVVVWQTLGDAYIRADRVQDALDAYTKAEELLR